MRRLLIDGDELVWRVAVTARDAAALKGALRRRIEALLSALRADHAWFALSDRGNWRKALWPGYKAHRSARPRPPLLLACREALQEDWATRAAPGLEADDLLGLAATRAPSFALSDRSGCGAKPVGEPETERRISEPRMAQALRAERFGAAPGVCASAQGRAAEEGLTEKSLAENNLAEKNLAEERVIVSRDKDLLTVPGLHGSPSGALRRVSADDAAAAHLAQCLSGDAADGYPGCPGIGPKRARRILDAAPPFAEARWRAVVEAYATAGKDEAEALLQARLARVLRAGEIDAEGRPILWRPFEP